MHGCTLVSCKTGSDKKAPDTDVKFEETWESLAKVEREPEWFKDAKLGIYFHWGVYSVPAYGSEWYPRWMYALRPDRWGGDIFEHHKKTYGPVLNSITTILSRCSRVRILMLKNGLTCLKTLGQNLPSPVAQHHDGFAMWDSKLNPWNAKAMGPKKDILGALFAELKKNDMKTIATFHHERLLQLICAGYRKVGAKHT